MCFLKNDSVAFFCNQCQGFINFTDIFAIEAIGGMDIDW